jgi:hypothetical protein
MPCGCVPLSGRISKKRSVTNGRVVKPGGVVIERSVTIGRIVGAGGKTEERPAALSRVAIGISSIWWWGRESRSRCERKRKADERDGDEKETASEGRAANRFSEV